MANDYWILTVAVSKDEIPASFNSINDITVQYSESRPSCIGYSHRTPDLYNYLKTIVLLFNKAHLLYLTEPVAILNSSNIRNAQV